MSTVDEASRLLSMCIVLGLEGVEDCEGMSIEQLAEDYNGIGPEWFPDVVRRAIDALEEDLEPMAFIHDVQWAHSDGSYARFRETNEMLARNGKKIAFEKYGWYDPRRYIRWRTSVVFSRLCADFGWPAYAAAFRKQNKE